MPSSLGRSASPFALALVAGVLACPVAALAGPTDPASAAVNPPAEGFDLEGSDPAAIELADRIMVAMGGREAYDQTRFVSWRFFGRRQHYWDRWTGDVRIEGESGEDDARTSFVLLYNVEDRSGRVFLDGEELPGGPEREEWMRRAHGMWVNDSYWVFMPFKLKDSGVTLKHRGRRTLDEFGEVDVLELTFEGVGLTPENRYEIFVDPRTQLVSAWSYYERAQDSEPYFTLPWKGYVRVGRILLASDHGREMDWELRSYPELPSSVFTSSAPVELD